MIVIGIDPGLTGAVAFVDHNGLRAVHDLPTMPIVGIGPAATVQREIDPVALRDLLRASVPADEEAIAVEANQGGGQPAGVSTTNTVNSTFELSNSNAPSTLGAGTVACEIHAFAFGNVTDNGTNNTVIARRNAVTPYAIGRQLRISYVNTPVIELAVDGRTGTWKFSWSASATADFGARFTGPNGALPVMMGDENGTAKLGFFNTMPIVKQAVTGSWGNGTALRSLLARLVAYGLLTDETTP
ncbi:hypothetical protein [Burkholderia orbicola]|uniref:hypothetical protein n=1 Tax=Burkholderia orbicola TaxID=2978683 RepID=UPI002FDF833B